MARARTATSVKVTFAGPKVTMSGIPGTRNIIDNIKFMRNGLLRNVTKDLDSVGEAMASKAMERAQTAYESHPERHPDPTGRYLNPDPAAQSIRANSFRIADRVGVSIGYDANVIQTVGSRAPITYGGILESEYHGHTAVIAPTFLEGQALIQRILDGALDRYAGSISKR